MKTNPPMIIGHGRSKIAPPKLNKDTVIYAMFAIGAIICIGALLVSIAASGDKKAPPSPPPEPPAKPAPPAPAPVPAPSPAPVPVPVAT